MSAPKPLVRTRYGRWVHWQGEWVVDYYRKGRRTPSCSIYLLPGENTPEGALRAIVRYLADVRDGTRLQSRR